jgi:rhodanese-related sulfurtransferase
MLLALTGVSAGRKFKRGVSMSMTKEAVRDKMKDFNVMVLNVLPESDYAKLHIKGSENLPLGQNTGDFAEAVEKHYGRDKFFITYCAGATCQAGPNAAKALKEKGFKANDYPGGMKEWSEAGFPTEGLEAKDAATAGSTVSK